jgi:hypothetical protein
MWSLLQLNLATAGDNMIVTVSWRFLVELTGDTQVPDLFNCGVGGGDSAPLISFGR